MGTSRTSGHHRVIGPHEPVFDRYLAGNEVDQPAMNEMRTDSPRSTLVKHDTLGFYAWKTADAGSDGNTGAQPCLLIHVREPRVFACLTGSVESEHDERVHLPLDLMINAFCRIEPVLVISGLHLTCDSALLVARV